MNRPFAGADVDCDGHADVLVRGAVVLDGDPRRSVPCSLGGLHVAALERAAGEPGLQWGKLVSIGDVDGDGCSDAAAMVVRQALMPDGRVPVRLWFRGARAWGPRWEAAGEVRHGLRPLGDVNHDGYADVFDCSHAVCAIFLGSATGIAAGPAFSLSGYERLIGGADFNGDGLGDFWALTAGGRADFYAGGSGTLPGAASAQFETGSEVPAISLADVDHDDVPELAGLRKAAGGLRWWRIAPSPFRLVEAPWPGRSKELPPWVFAPRVGPGRRGLCLSSAADPRAPSGLTNRPEQVAFNASGSPTLWSRAPLLALGTCDFIKGFSTIGDVDGNGFGDLLVRAGEDLGGERLFLARGSGAGYRAQDVLEMPEQNRPTLDYPLGEP